MREARHGWVPVGEAKIYYEVTGAGEPLVLLHGNGENLCYFDEQVPAFSQRYRVIAIDTRGHGRSTRGSGAFCFERFADDVAAVMDELDAEKAHLLGFSDGGNIALAFALRHPARLRSLILNGANLDPSGVKRATQLPVTAGYYAARALGAVSKEARKKSEVLGLMVKYPHLKPSRLSAVHVPTLVIAGERDMIRPEHTELIAQSIPGARLEIVPQADHFVAAKMPQIFNAIVLDFLHRLPTAQP